MREERGRERKQSESRGRERERESKEREKEREGPGDDSEKFNTVMTVYFYLLDSTSKSCQRLTKLHQELQQKT